MSATGLLELVELANYRTFNARLLRSPINRDYKGEEQNNRGKYDAWKKIRTIALKEDSSTAGSLLEFSMLIAKSSKSQLGTSVSIGLTGATGCYFNCCNQENTTKLLHPFV